MGVTIILNAVPVVLDLLLSQYDDNHLLGFGTT